MGKGLEHQLRAYDAKFKELHLGLSSSRQAVDDTSQSLAEQADGLRYCRLQLEKQTTEQQRLSQIVTDHDEQLLGFQRLQEKTMASPQQQYVGCYKSPGVVVHGGDSTMEV